MTPRETLGLGHYIREQRKLAKLSLRELSRLADVSNAYLSQVERGLHAPSLRILQSVAKALDVPVEELVRMMPGPVSALRDDTASPTTDVESAIRREERLSAEQKAALITVFRSFLEGRPDEGAAI